LLPRNAQAVGSPADDVFIFLFFLPFFLAPAARNAQAVGGPEINGFSFSFSLISPAARNAQAVGGPEDDDLSNWPEAREAGSP